MKNGKKPTNKISNLPHLSVADSKLSSIFIGIFFHTLAHCSNRTTRGAFKFFIRK